MTADSIAVLDERGERLPIGSRQANVWLAGTVRELVGGKSEAYSISEDARTLVLHRAGAEVSRVAIRITPGQVNVVRP